MINELIDLTENRDFGSPIRNNWNMSLFWDKISEIHNKELYGKTWIIKIERFEKEEKLGYDYLFPLGNKETIRNKKYVRYFGSGENSICDCCGSKFTWIPWRYNDSLCKKCANIYYKKKEIPWL